MYLQKIHIQNVKLIRDLELTFTHPDSSPRMWTVLIGRNGRGKTTLLHAIALAAAGATDTLGSFVAASFPTRAQDPPPVSTIQAQFTIQAPPLRSGDKGKRVRPQQPVLQLPGNGAVPQGAQTLHSSIRLAPGEALFTPRSWWEGVDPSTDTTDPLRSVRSSQLPFWMVAGYGVSRHLRYLESRPAPPATRQIERLRSLFTPDFPLLGLGFADLFEDEKRKRFVKLLQDLITKTTDLYPELIDVELRGRGGVRTSDDLLKKDRVVMRTPGDAQLSLPATFLSHGYQSSLAWMADLIGQFLLEDDDDKLKLEDLNGLALIDELDLHLHPTWQATFIQALKATFPNIQFIATTHSPLVLSSLKPEEIVVLELDDEGFIQARQGGAPDPRLRTGSELYAEFFEIRKTYPQPLGDKVREYSYLATDPFRDDDADQRGEALFKELKSEGITLSPMVPRQNIPPLDEWPDED